jgi:uncharacterized membrane protein
MRPASVDIRRIEYRSAAIIVILFAWGLALYDLSARSLWFDEAMEYWVATSGILEMPQSVRDGIQDPPLYSILLHFWMLGDQSEFYLRFLSVAASLLSVVGVMVLGRRWSGPSTALIAGTIMSFLPSQIRYAQEVGQYALMICLIAWTSVALQWYSRERNRLSFLVWTVLALAATYTYYGAAIAIVVPYFVVLAAGLIENDWWGTKDRLIAIFVYVVGVAPLAFYFLPEQLLRGPTANAFELSLGTPAEELKALWISTQQLIAFQFTGWPWTRFPVWLPIILMLLLLLLSLRQRPQRRQVTVWLLAVWIVYYVAAKLVLFPYGYRYGLILLPLLIPAIAHGLAGMFREKYVRFGGGVILLSFLTISAISFPQRSFREGIYPNVEWAWPETEDLKQVVAYWLENRVDSQPTYVYYGAVPGFGYYWQGLGNVEIDLPPTWFLDCWQGGLPEYCHAHNVHYGEWMREVDPTGIQRTIYETLSSQPEALWLVFSHIAPGQDTAVLDSMLGDYRIAGSYVGTNASVYLLEAK